MSRYTNETTVKVTGNIKVETGKAILVMVSAVNDIRVYPEDEHRTKSVWFPFSQVSAIRRNPDAQDELRVKEWIVKKTAEFEQLLDNPNEPPVRELDGNIGFKGTAGARTREDDEGYEQDPDDFPF